MGVIVTQIPAGSGKWYVRIKWPVAKGQVFFRKTKLVGSGEKGKEAAEYKARVLDEAWMKFGPEAVKLIEEHLQRSGISVVAQGVKAKWQPTAVDLAACRDMGHQVAQAIQA